MPKSVLPRGTDAFTAAQLFLIFYWIMTGLHGLHVTIGMGVVVVLAVLAWRGRFSAA